MIDIITDASAFITGHQLFDFKHIWRSRWEFFTEGIGTTTLEFVF